MAVHKNLPDSELHEPKGASTASANQVYVADGAGSGSFSSMPASGVAVTDADGYYSASTVEAILKEIYEAQHTGWCQYLDGVYTGATELTITDVGSGTQLTNNKATSIESNAPLDMTTTLWNSSTNKFTPINENDYYIIRITFDAATVSGTINYVTLNLDIGGSQGIIWSETITPDKGAGEKFSFTIPVYTGSTFVPNGGTFYLLKNGGGTFTIQNIGISIARIHKGV